MALWKTEDKTGAMPKHLRGGEGENVYGIDVNEAAGNRHKGIRTPGWVKHITYTNSAGVVRNKVETLVTARSMSTEFDEDAFQNFAMKVKRLVGIGVLPGAGFSLATEVTITPEDGAPTPTYQWQVLEDGEWEDLDGATTAILTMPEPEEEDSYSGMQLRVVVSADGLDDVVSNTANIKLAEITAEPPEGSEELEKDGEDEP